MQEKKIGRGEDSDPILFSDSNIIVCGVFDGMGGAGATEYPSDFSHDGMDMTKAYIGSRIVRNAIENLIKSNTAIVLEGNFASVLKETILARYNEEKEKFPPKSKGGLRSALIKEYPTTLALACVNKSEDIYVIDSYWAGDSRNYLWTTEGLFQISIDDLKGELDPLENLHEDAPMSNCIHADGPFAINHKRIKLKGSEKFVIISATDGCFGYYPSPMDFERSLTKSLKRSNTIEEWKPNMEKEFSYVTADDFSFSMAGIGFKDFKELQKSLSKPNKLVKPFSKKRESVEKEVTTAEDKLYRLHRTLENQVLEFWPKYRKSYLKYMNDDEER